MGSSIDNSAFLEDNNPISLLHRRQTMGDHQHGSSLHRLLQAELHRSLRFSIESAGGFIQQKQGRIPQDGPGDGDSLQLSSGDIASPLLQQGFVAVGEALDEPISIGQPCRFHHVSIAGATSVLINITGNSELTMFEAHEASTMIQEEAHEDANVIWGWVIDESMEDEARVTVIATGFEEQWLQARPDVEQRIRQVIGGNSRGGGFRESPPPRRGIASGLNPDDYDIPTFFKNAD